MAAPNVLVVANDPATVKLLNSLLGIRYGTEAVAMGAAAVERAYRNPSPDLVLLKLGAGQNEELQTLRNVLRIRPDLKVVLLSEPGESGRVVEAIRIGAQDYITSPFREEELLRVIRRHVNGHEEVDRQVTESAEEVGGGHFFVSASPLMRKIRRQAELFANIDVPVLITGESGTGKEVLARLIHKLSARSDRRFLKVDCAVPPEDLGELLDAPKRTNGNGAKPCNTGTVLLDEVADMSTDLQAKVLHALQDTQSVTEGAKVNVCDVRILASTNVDIQHAMGQRHFREDLYYRLSAFTISLPPLRDRREGIPMLLRHFMERIAAQYSKSPLAFSPCLVDACLQYTWPGNLRELQNFAKRYLVMGDENVAIEELSAHQRRKSIPVETILRRRTQTPAAITKPALTAEERARDLKYLIRNLKDEAEVKAITKALDETKWNRKSAAQLLHISYRGLLYKLRRHDIKRISSYETPARKPQATAIAVQHSEEITGGASSEVESLANSPLHLTNTGILSSPRK